LSDSSISRTPLPAGRMLAYCDARDASATMARGMRDDCPSPSRQGERACKHASIRVSPPPRR